MKRWSAYTLVELIVASAISSIVLMGLVYVIFHSNDVLSQISFTQQRTSILTDTYNRVYNNVRVAVSFPTTATIDGTTYTVSSLSTSQTLIMQLYSISSDGRILCDATGKPTIFDTIVYTTDSNNNLLEIYSPNQFSARPKHTQVIMDAWSSLNFAQTKTSASDHRIIAFLLGKRYNSVEKQINQTMVARND